MEKIEMEKVMPYEYNFANERMDLAALIGYEYGILCQATGEYFDSMNVMAMIRDAAFNYNFVIMNPDDSSWSIDIGKARNFAEQKAEEIHDEIIHKNDDDDSQNVAEEITELLQRTSKLEEELKEFKSLLNSVEKEV